MGILVSDICEAGGGRSLRQIEIDRPASANALDVATLLELCETIEDAGRNDAVGAIVITARGARHFCAGADMREARTHARAAGFRDGLERLLRRLYALEKPAVAAVEGPAAGAGAMIALAVDRSILAEDAFLAFPEMSASVPPLLAFELLAETAGTGIARELSLTGRKIGAEECLHFGLVAQATAKENVRAAAARAALELASCPKVIYAQFKRHLAERFEPLISRTCRKMAT